MIKKKEITIRELCDVITMSYKALGSVDRCVTVPSSIDDANEDSISFCSKNTEDALEIIRNSKAGVIFCSSNLEFAEEDYKDRTLILVSNPKLAFTRIMQRYFAEKVQFGISATAVVDKTADIHPNVYIGPHCYIGRCEIGEGTIIYGNVYIYSNVKIGRKVIINAGTVIGAEGMEYARNEKGEFEKSPHIAGVIIEDSVEIGSNVSIMRGVLSNTLIGRGTKIGHLCNIGHQAIIGKHCLIGSQSMLGGSCRIGDYSRVSLDACIRDRIEVGKNALIGMGSVVTKNVGDGQVVFGVPAREHKKLQ
jgi:UDP-3-O-[3-hydroxymyristoyl] glucosamine N-acyltransferase